MYISLEEAKKHLNIDPEFTEDDAYIESLIAVAEDAVAKHIDMALYDLSDDDGCLPSGLKHAILLFVGNMYDHRESTITLNINEVPLAYNYLLDLYQKY